MKKIPGDIKIIILASLLLVGIMVFQVMHVYNTTPKPITPVKEINDVFKKDIENDLKDVPKQEKIIQDSKDKVNQIDNKQNQKSHEYETQITLINSADASQLTNLFTTQLNEYKVLDGQGYFSLPN